VSVDVIWYCSLFATAGSAQVRASAATVYRQMSWLTRGIHRRVIRKSSALGQRSIAVQVPEKPPYSAASDSTTQKFDFPESCLDSDISQRYMLPCAGQGPGYGSRKGSCFVADLVEHKCSESTPVC